MSDSVLVAATQISTIVSALSKKNYKQSVAEINQLVEQYKTDVENHLFRVLFATVDFSGSEKTQKDSQKCQLLINEINIKLSKPNFPSLLCQSIDYLHIQRGLKPSNQLFLQLSKVLKLNKVQEVVFSLYLTKSSNKEIINIANQWLRQKYPDLIRSYVDGDSGGKERAGFQDINIELLHLILTHLWMDKDNFGIGEDQMTAFLDSLRKDFPKDSVPVILSGILYNEEDPLLEKSNKDHIFFKHDSNYFSNILEEIGSVTTSSLEEMRNIMQDFDSTFLTPSAVAKCICMFMRSFGQNTVDENESFNWNFDIFFAVIFEKNEGINKRQVIEELDCKEFDATQRQSLIVLQNCIMKCLSPFPVAFFYKQWKNSVAQLSFLKGCLSYLDVIYLPSFNHKSCDISVFNLKVDEDEMDMQMAYWKNIDFIDSLLVLSDAELLSEVSELFEMPMSMYPHILLCSLIQSTLNNSLKMRLLYRLFMVFIRNPNCPVGIFSVCHKINPDCLNLILNALFDYYKDYENNHQKLPCIHRISEIIISELQVVFYILPNNNDTPNIFKANVCFRYEVVHFALDIIIFRTRKNSEFLIQWVTELLTKEANPLRNFKALVSYINIRYPKLFENENSKFIVPSELLLDLNCLLDFLRSLIDLGKSIFQSDLVIPVEMQLLGRGFLKLSQIVNSSMSASGGQPRQAIAPGHAVSKTNRLDPTRSAFVPQSKMVRTDMPVGMVDQPRQHDYMQQQSVVPPHSMPDFKVPDYAGSKYTQQVVRPNLFGGPNLMDEKMVTKVEPTLTVEQEIEKNLKMLFSGEISLEAMYDIYCNPAKSKKDHLNGLIKVLLEELAFIHQYPEKQGRIYSDLFIQILNSDSSIISKSETKRIFDYLINMQNTINSNDDYKLTTGKDIINRIVTANYSMRKAETTGVIDQMPTASVMSLSQSAGTAAVASLATVTAPNAIGTIESPPESITEKVYFIINNVSKMNVQEKAGQLAEAVTPEHMPWFAQYIVMKRVTTEANFHELFIQLIDYMSEQLSGLKEKVLAETYRNIKILLSNMKSELTDFNDRQLLKNLGRFLGMITLAKNKPILHDDMNLKDMLYEAFSKGHVELHYVVPFVTKTLEAAKDSIVFKPPCPWTMAILKVLKELHEVEHVKLNLKFEVEILCRNLKIDFSKLPAAIFLKDRNVRIENSLCRIVPTVPAVSTGSSADLATATVVVESGPQRPRLPGVDSRLAMSTRGAGPSMDSLDSVGARSANLRSTLPFQQSVIPASIAQQSSAAVAAASGAASFPSVSMRSSVPDMPHYISLMNAAAAASQPTFGGPQHSNHMLQPDQSPHAVLRTLNISYDELNTNNIGSCLNVDDVPAPILAQIPNLKIQLISTMERIVFELVSPLYDRCAKITISTVEQLVLKDFGTDCDFNMMKQYAFGMCRNLTAGLCLVTAREIIGVHLNTAVKQTILGEYRHVNSQDKEQVDNFANKIVNSNNEICVAFLQKILAEKALNELEKKLNSIIPTAPVGSDGQKRAGPMKFSAQDLQVYDNFNRSIPGFASVYQQQPQSATMPPMAGSGSIAAATAAGSYGNKNPIGRMITEIERQMALINNVTRNETFHRCLRKIVDAACLALQNNDAQLIHRLMRETVSSFMNVYHSQIIREYPPPQGLEIMERLKEAHLYSLRIMQPHDETAGFMSVNKQVTLAWSNMEETKPMRPNSPGKWNAEAFYELLKAHVISLPAMDLFLSKKIVDGNISALMFVLDLLKFFVTGDKREFTVLNEFDLSATIDSMGQIVSNNQLKLPPELLKLVNINLAKINQLLELGCLEKSPSSIYLYNGISLSREFDDPPAMAEKAEIMLRLWMENYFSSSQRNGTAVQNIIATMAQHQLIHNDEAFVRFLRLASVYVVERVHKQLKQDTAMFIANRSPGYMEIDAYAMLVCSLVNKCQLNKNEVAGRSCLLNKSLGIIAGTLLQEHEVRRDWFHPMPFQRMLVMLFGELQQLIDEEQQQNEFQFHVLTAFAHTYHVIRPKCAPSFVFSWLELISHRSFIARMLQPTGPNSEYTHCLYMQLLCDLFSFLRPYLENLHLPKPVQIIYKGAVSLTFLLMHDFPEILINYHALLCSVFPVNCVQLRNIILCTTPKKMVPLPDVRTNNFVEQLSQMEDPTGYCMHAGERIRPHNLRVDLDSYLASRAPVKFLSELVNGLKKDSVGGTDLNQLSNTTIVNSKEVAALMGAPEEHIGRGAFFYKATGEQHYDVELMNNVMLYLCITATRTLRDKNIPLNINTIAHTAQMDIIQSLVLNLDNEGRFLLLNCMANQLRFPNSHTYYFMYTILYLFAEQPQDCVKEQITRVILERIIVNRPHQWGILVLMNELFKNPAYKFWDHKFVYCSDDVEKILDSVVRGCRCTIPTPTDEMNPSGVVSES